MPTVAGQLHTCRRPAHRSPFRPTVCHRQTLTAASYGPFVFRFVGTKTAGIRAGAARDGSPKHLPKAKAHSMSWESIPERHLRQHQRLAVRRQTALVPACKASEAALVPGCKAHEEALVRLPADGRVHWEP